MKRKGISLIMLVITIIVIIILAAAVILTLFNTGLSDKAVKARFMNDFRTVQEAVNIYAASNYNQTTSTFDLPIKGYLTSSDKSDIANNVPTLKTKIESLSGPIDTVNLAWIDTNKINVKLSPTKQDKGYIIDVDSKQIYDYVGDFFENLRWHTLDGGVAQTGTTNTQTSQEMWDGWMTLTLYYPANSTARQWRLGTAAGTAGDLRADPITMWQDYTGPIRVPIDRVQDVWIRYMLNNSEVTIPPAGTLLVDIVPDKTGATKVPQVNVFITYDSTADTKEYRVGSSAWMPYNGPFVVTENCVVEARASKTDYVYNTDGSLLTTRQITGKDMVYIGNIGVEETDLPAPTITRVAPSSGSEVAGVQISYPSGAAKQIYKINYGVEQNYTSTISIPSYGEYVIAYYYDASGKRSLSSSIYINDTSTGAAPASASAYTLNPPYVPGQPAPTNLIPPADIIPAPTVNVSPTSLTSAAQVSVNAPYNANKVYIKLGRYGTYQEYTAPITVRQNMEIYAYYITLAGEISDTGHGVVNNIQQPNMPYVYIDANPYPWSGSYGASSVTVTINSSNANTLQYSEDGIVYQPYTAPFTVNQNETVYARATNSYGTSETSLNITNIGQITAPTPMQNLSINIGVNPEPTLSTSQVLKATVAIDYDPKATEKYYTIGKYGALQTYTGSFDVTSNCTIYAYAKATNAQGSTSKVIDNISNGISEPIITSTPGNNLQASKDTISITFDKNATIKKYSINGGTLSDYIGAFDVTTNGAVIYAYGQNALGQSSTSTYVVQNIVPEPPVLVLDLGQYYILKLNYPDGSKTREYKWKANGVWKTYPEAGIMLIKPEYQNQLIQNGTLVKIKDENGNLVTFTGDYYLIDVPINELSENIFMRWDRVPLPAPQIIINPTTAAKQVTVTIAYNSGLIKKQYRIIAPDGTIGAWQDYTGPFTIDQNNTAIDANGMDETEVWTPDAMLKITNIDEVPPVITLTADLIAAQQQVAVKVHVTDDVAVGKVKWAAGAQGESYFKTAGTEVLNDSIVNITSNGYYTFYAEDQVGNTQVYTLNVTNVDLTPPAIDIAISPTTVGTSATATINYGDSTTKQYKVGTSNSTWSDYTAPVSLSSYTILANNWQNSDGTVTIYAKGVDSAGNAITVQKVVVNLDLDAPKTPVINANAGYPLLTSYGVTFDSSVTISYDTRTDIDNYYSIDNGTTWLPYTGSFNLSNGSIIAKSVKKNTGLQVSVTKTVTMPSDALTQSAYDNDDTTYTSMLGKYIKVDSSMQGQMVRIKLNAVVYARINVRFMDANRQLISSFDLVNGLYDSDYLVPNGTAWITAAFTDGTSNQGNLYEIQPANEPKFTATNGYMLLTADVSKVISQPYQMVSISYFYTSVQRYYRIGTNGDWLPYNDQPIKVNQGDTIYAKGIDKNGNETRMIPSYTSNSTDALPHVVYDADYTTGISNINSRYMDIASDMQGQKIRVKFNGNTSSSGPWNNAFIEFLDSNKTLISQFGGPYAYDQIITVPTNARWIYYYADGVGASTIYEIEPANEPVIVPTTVYMLLTLDSSKVVKDPYQSVTINYSPTSAQKLYQIGSTTGTWLNYTAPIKMVPGQTIYAKGVDLYGNDTRVISSFTSSLPDALTKEAYDGNDSTYTTMLGKYMQIGSDMQGKNMRLKLNAVTYARVNVRFMDVNRTIISSFDVVNGMFDGAVNIPMGTVWLTAAFTDGTSNQGNVYEIQVADEPTFSNITDGFMNLAYDPTKAITAPYQTVTINYFQTSVQKLYQIGSTTGTWLNYTGPVRVSQGQTIYAKGIDQYGKETRVISSYTANSITAVGSQAYDGNYSTYFKNNVNANSATFYMDVDPSMQGRSVRIKMNAISSSYCWGGYSILDSTGTVIYSSPSSTSYDQTITVPAGAARISFGIQGNFVIYEVQPM